MLSLLQELPKLAAAAACASIVTYNIFLQFVVPPMVLKQMRKELGTEVSIKTLVVRPLAGVFELRGLVVKGDTATTFATIDVLRCTTTGPLGTLSLAGPQTFSLGMHVPWVVGFRGKMIEHVAVEGCTVVVEETDGKSNGAFMKRRDARIKAKSAAKKRRVLEKELRWRLLHVDDKEAVRKRLELLRSLDEDSDSDDEHEAYMESAAADWDAAEASPGKQSYAERLQAARERVHARVAARVQARADDHAQRELQEDLRKTYATIRPAFDDELIHIGSLAVERRARRLRDGVAVVAQYFSHRLRGDPARAQSAPRPRRARRGLLRHDEGLPEARRETRDDGGAGRQRAAQAREGPGEDQGEGRRGARVAEREGQGCERDARGRPEADLRGGPGIVNFDTFLRTTPSPSSARSAATAGAPRRRRGPCRTSRETSRRPSLRIEISCSVVHHATGRRVLP